MREERVFIVESTTENFGFTPTQDFCICIYVFILMAEEMVVG